MKISILTATYNRANFLNNLYCSIKKNLIDNILIEWLIMDDGSTDDTKSTVDSFIKENLDNNLEIKYYFQENHGKMDALNNLISNISSDSTLLIECDSDDYLCNNAIKTIYTKYSEIKDESNIYALCFLKNDKNQCNIGSLFKSNNYETNMFNLYFKDGITGDKALVYISSIRKKYNYILENGEKFSTEARMYNQMDKNYNIVCFNSPIMVCDYLNEGYSKNIKKIFLENPCGYYEYFKQLINFDMHGVLFSKRLYIIKHYILFSYLTKQKNILKNVKGAFNKFLVILLYVPGIAKSWLYEQM
jgi:glycosyltransferase involved in cell wall biosynthesis